jgi:hypothetical protein
LLAERPRVVGEAVVDVVIAFCVDDQQGTKVTAK